MIAFLENEPGADKIGEMLKQARDSQKLLFLSVVNWGEVYYILCRSAGKEAAEEALQAIDTLPVETVPVDREITGMAAALKSIRKMSYADCFAAALAKLKKAELVAGDKEFREVEHAVKIAWL